MRDEKKKVSQGQGGGTILKSVSGLMGSNKDNKLSDADKKFAQEALEEQQLLESMEQTNKIAQELMKQESETNDLKNEISMRDKIIEDLNKDMRKAQEDLQVRAAELKHYKTLYEDSYE